MKRSPAEILLGIHLKELGLPYEEEIKFHPERKWRWDFLLTGTGIAIEVDGFFRGRHGSGWGSDNEKRNTGTMMGFRILVFSTKSVLRGEARDFIKSYLCPT